MLETVVLHNIFVETDAFYFFPGFTDEQKIYLKQKSFVKLLISLLSLLINFMHSRWIKVWINLFLFSFISQTFEW